MSFETRTERNIAFLDNKIHKLEEEAVALKKLRFKLQGMLTADNNKLIRIVQEMGLKVTLTKLHKEYYKRKSDEK